jgi:predicted porin
MKKIAIIAALSALSFAAAAQVTVSGKISEWVDNTKTGSVSATGLTADSTSNITIRAAENLGKGLTARVVIDTRILANDPTSAGTQIGDRQSTVGLASKVGSVDLGRNVHSQFLAVSNNDAFSTLYGSVAGDVHNLRGLRFSNGAFVAVNPMKNVSVTYDRSSNAGAATESTSYSLSAKVGPVNATYARFEQGSVEVSNVIGANATLGATTVFYSHSDNKSAVVGETKKGNLIGVTQKIGVITAKASYGETDNKVSAYNVGLDYALSKRTQVGVAYRNVDLVGSTHDVKQLGIGLTHQF